MKKVPWIVTMISFLITACSQGDGFEIVKVLEHRDNTLYNAYFRGYAYVTVNDDIDSLEIRKIAPRIRETVVRQSNKQAFLSLQIIFDGPLKKRLAIYDMRYNDETNETNAQFVYYKGKYINAYNMDKRLKERVRRREFTLPKDVIGAWYQGNIEIFYHASGLDKRVTFMDGASSIISPNKLTTLRPFDQNGQKIYRGYFLSDFFGPDSSDFVINQQGDLEVYQLFPYFKYLYPKMDIQEIMADNE